MASTTQLTGDSTEQRTEATKETSVQNNQRPQTANAFDTTRRCTECGQMSFDRTAAGEWYCRDCGAVQSTTELEFTEPGWRPQAQRRTGPSSSPARLSDGSIIGQGNGGPSHRARQLDNRLAHDKATLRHGLKELRAVAAALDAHKSLTEQAAYQYRRAAAEELLPGHSIEAMAAACIHAVARENGTPYPKKQLGDVSPVEFDDICSAYSRLCRTFDLRPAPPLPTDFVGRFVSEAELPQAVRRRALETGQQLIDDEKHVGQSPTGVAGALVYGAALASGEQITQDEMADIAYVSPVTLSRQWQSVKEYID